MHHVYGRGNERARIFFDDRDRTTYLRILGRVIGRQGWRCLAYCLMDNHVHLLIETPRANLGAGMQRLHGLYGQRYNERYRRLGHVFQGRYGSVRVKDDPQLFATVAYIVRNPVEAGLCGQPEGWPWSSHAATLAGRSPEWLDVDGLLGYFTALGGEPRLRYAELTTP